MSENFLSGLAEPFPPSLPPPPECPDGPPSDVNGWYLDDDQTPIPMKQHQLEVLTWTDFKDKPVPQVRYCWEPFIPHVPFGMLGSHPGVGKSILALQIVASKAVGFSLFGYPTGAPAGTGLLALEDDRNVLHRRLAAFVEGHREAGMWGQEQDELLAANLRLLVERRRPLAQLSPEVLNFALAHLVQELGAALTTTRDPAELVFLDTLNALNPGDENSAQEARPLIAAVRALHASTGCSAWAIHHLRKTGVGKQSPNLTDRLDPELFRGSSAFLGAVRAAAQLGWVNSDEADKVGLEPQGAARRYSILALTKVNDGPRSPWLLLEHTDRAGLWAPVKDGEEILAQLRGARAAGSLQKAEILLLDIYRGTANRQELAEKHFPKNPKAADRLKSAISELRRRHGWLQSGSMELTVKGLQKAQELGRQAEESADLLGGEDE
jgi:hypothetical protein